MVGSARSEESIDHLGIGILQGVSESPGASITATYHLALAFYCGWDTNPPNSPIRGSSREGVGKNYLDLAVSPGTGGAVFAKTTPGRVRTPDLLTANPVQDH